MNQLVQELKKDKILCDGGRILASTDGCAKQCKCSTAICWMSLLSFKHNVVVDRAIGCPAHGKCEVDAINGVDKNTICRELTKQLAAPEKVCKSSSTADLLQPFSFSNVSGEGKHSAAENCKAVLEKMWQRRCEICEQESKEGKRKRHQQQALACEKAGGETE